MHASLESKGADLDYALSLNKWTDFVHEHSFIHYVRYTKDHLSSLHQPEHPDLSESFSRLLDPSSRFIGSRLRLSFFHGSLGYVQDDIARAASGVGMSLLLAARLGLSKTVQWLLSFDGDSHNGVHCDINFTCVVGGWTYGPALAEASARGHIDVIRLLLSNQYRARLDLDRTAGERSKNALQLAASHGHEDVVRLLINAGVDVNGQHSFGGTALHLASGETTSENS
jgi:hypothetical protein